MTKLPKVRALSFGHKFGSRYGPVINPEFLLGYDPFDDDRLKKAAVNMKDLNEYFELEVLLPGFQRSEIKIQLEGNNLLIRAEKTANYPAEAGYIINEYSRDSLERSFKLGVNTDRDRITARLKKGILYIRLYPMKKVSGEVKKTVMVQ